MNKLSLELSIYYYSMSDDKPSLKHNLNMSDDDIHQNVDDKQNNTHSSCKENLMLYRIACSVVLYTIFTSLVRKKITIYMHNETLNNMND